jgi:type IV pilus assembly protein PilM
LAPLFLGAPPPPVGLDIGTDFIRAAQIKSTSGGLVVTNYGWVPMPFGAVVEGEIVDPEAVSGALRELWKRYGFHVSDVAIGISSQKVVVRLIDLQFMERDELAKAIQYQAQDYIPYPVEQAILDFQVIGDYMTPADEHMMEMLLVAAPREIVTSAVQAIEGAKLRLAQVDVTAFALVRALLGTNPSWFNEEVDNAGEALGIVHMSSGLTNIAVVERGIPRFTRVSSMAGNQFTQAIANVLNLTFDEAEELKAQAGLPSIDLAAGAPATPEAPNIQTAQEALEREANKFIAEVRRSLDYYLTQATQVRSIKRIYLTGTGSQLTNLASYLEKGLQTEVIVGDPLSHVSAAGSVEQAIMADRMGCAPAIGLALGGLT